MNTRKVLLACVGGMMALAMNHSHAAEELVVTALPMAKMNKDVISIDVATQGETVAIQFNIELPKGVDASQVNLSRCMADLPKTHQGECSVAKGQIIGIAYNDDGIALPAGLVSIGKVEINAGMSARAKQNFSRSQNMRVAKFVAASADGTELNTSSTVARD